MRHLPPARPPLRHLLGAVATITVVGAATASSFASHRPAGLPTAASVAGTCHADQDPNELRATLSDTSPAVPCSGPHQTQTAFQLPVTGALARQRSRPNPELLETAYAGVCVDYARIRTFLGAGPSDVYWGITAYARYPTPAEWAAGVRTIDCDLSSDPTGAQGPVMDRSLAGILRRADSAGYRLCRRGDALVTCAQPHDAEATSPDVALPPGDWPGTAAETAAARAACIPIAGAYLGGPLSTRPSLSIEPAVADRSRWDRGDRRVDCWIATSGPPSAGTLRSALGHALRAGLRRGGLA